MNFRSTLLGVASLPIVAVYPFMKRYTYWPQSVLGMAKQQIFRFRERNNTHRCLLLDGIQVWRSTGVLSLVGPQWQAL